MKRILVFASFMLLYFTNTAECPKQTNRTFCGDTNCMVLVTELKSDYWVGYEDYGYVIFELYGYTYIDEDDVICGNIHSYGFKDAYNATKEKSIRIYIEDYGLSKQRCIDWINSHDKWKD